MALPPTSASKDDLSSPTPENMSFSGPAMAQHTGTTPPNESFMENVSFATRALIEKVETMNGGEDDGWQSIANEIRLQVGQSPSAVLANSEAGDRVRFFPYPPAIQENIAGRTQPPDDPSLVKVFLGNMRFEMGRLTIAWAVKAATGVDVSPQHILVHFRANGTVSHPTPTGCASLFVKPEFMTAVLDFNQRIFCGAKGIFVAATPEAMRQLIMERRVLDLGADGRVRGPKHAMVVEQSRPQQNGSLVSTSPNASFLSASPSSGIYTSQQNSSFPQSASQQQSFSEPEPVYNRYPGPQEVPETDPPEDPSTLIEFFIGGICYEATEHFVAWMLSLTGAKVSASNVTLFEDHKTGTKSGCAMVKVRAADTAIIQPYHHRFLCDANGVYVSPTPFQGVSAFLRRQKARGEPVRGPTHAVVIEKRRSQPTPPMYSPPPTMAGTTTGVPSVPMELPPPPSYAATLAKPAVFPGTVPMPLFIAPGLPPPARPVPLPTYRSANSPNLSMGSPQQRPFDNNHSPASMQ